MIGDMSVLISTFNSNLPITLARKNTGNFVKGKWVESTSTTYTFYGVVQDITPSIYEFYEGYKISLDGKIIYVYSNLKAINNSNVEVDLLIQQDDLITYESIDYIVVGVLKNKQEINITTVLMEKVVVK